MLSTAIIRAGPYGLSIAAHFRRSGVPFRISGRPMASWLAHMPKGMMLKSDGFASDIYDRRKRSLCGSSARSRESSMPTPVCRCALILSVLMGLPSGTVWYRSWKTSSWSAWSG